MIERKKEEKIGISNERGKRRRNDERSKERKAEDREYVGQMEKKYEKLINIKSCLSYISSKEIR